MLRLRRSRWQDKAQVLSLAPQPGNTRPWRSRSSSAPPGGRYVHRRMRCSGSDLKSGLGHLFDPNPETLAYAG